MANKTTVLHLALVLFLSAGPCWGQRVSKRVASTGRPSAPARTAPPAPTDDFPGQIRPDFVASVLLPAAPVATPRAAPTTSRPPALPAPGLVPSAADLQQIDYLKGKMQLGMPLEADERAYLLLWMQQHPRKPKKALTNGQ